MRLRREKDRGTRVLLHDFGAYPFTIQLARQLSNRGYVTSYVYYVNLPGPKGNCESADGSPELRVYGVKTCRDFDKYKYLKRSLQECEYGLRVACRIARSRPDVVASANSPPIVQLWITLATKMVGARSVVWVQDVFGVASGSILSGKMGAVGRVVASVLNRIDRLNLTLARPILVISPSFVDALTSAGIDKTRIAVLPNWAPVDDLPYYPDRPHLWGEEHGLSNRFCFMYTGALGDKHDPTPLLQLAEHYGSDDSVRVVVVSEGPGARRLEKEARARDLRSLVVLPYQPFDQVPLMMAEADVLVSILTHDASGFSVPSKVLSYLCAGRPIVCLMEPSNYAAELVLEIGAGLVVDTADVVKFVEVCAALAKDEAQQHTMGVRGRDFAERAFEPQQVTDRFEELVIAPYKR